jgi:NO-binding membrane sensor protein with MHYT domain
MAINIPKAAIKPMVSIQHGWHLWRQSRRQHVRRIATLLSIRRVTERMSSGHLLCFKLKLLLFGVLLFLGLTIKVMQYGGMLVPTSVSVLLWRLIVMCLQSLLISSLCMLIRLKRIYNFWCSMLVFTPSA